MPLGFLHSQQEHKQELALCDKAVDRAQAQAHAILTLPHLECHLRSNRAVDQKQNHPYAVDKDTVNVMIDNDRRFDISI